MVWQEGAHGKTLTTVSIDDTREDVLQTVFENGNIVKDWTWDQVKANSQIELLEEM